MHLGNLLPPGSSKYFPTLVIFDKYFICNLCDTILFLLYIIYHWQISVSFITFYLLLIFVATWVSYLYDLKLLNVFYGLVYDKSWVIFHVDLQRIFTLLIVGVGLYEKLSGLIGCSSCSRALCHHCSNVCCYNRIPECGCFIKTGNLFIEQLWVVRIHPRTPCPTFIGGSFG